MKKLLTLAALVAAFSLLIATWPAEPARAAANIPLGMMHQFMLPQTAASVSTGFTADRLNKFTSAPGCPVAGYLFYDTTADTVKACNNALSAAVIGTSLPALSDNGTVVTSTEVFRGPDGLVTAPSYSFTNGTGRGLNFITSGDVLQVVGNTFDLYATGSFGTTNPLLRLGPGATEGIRMTATGSYAFSSSTPNAASADTWIARRGAANIRLGSVDVNGSPVAQTLSVQNAITGTDLPGAAAFTFAAPLGTGAGAGSSTQFQRALMGATGTTAQTGIAAFVVCESKTLSNTSATTTALANIALASNSGGGARGSITVVATDGTNFDSETQDFVVSYVNKATVGTVGTAAITASTAANNSGSATIGMTATFAGTTLSIKATPVFTTIVPTTVTAYLELQNHGAGAVTCQ